MTRTQETRKARYRFYRGYIYTRVTPMRLRLCRPDGAFLCDVPSPRVLVREVNQDIRRTQLVKTLTI